MFKTACAAALLVFATTASAEAAGDLMTLAPHYNVSGTNPNGSHYAGTVDVDVISNTTFLVAWHIGSGTSSGFGMRMGDTISATYLLGDKPGLIIYRANGAGGFKGIWAIRGQNGSGTETWTPAN